MIPARSPTSSPHKRRPPVQQANRVEKGDMRRLRNPSPGDPPNDGSLGTTPPLRLSETPSPSSSRRSDFMPDFASHEGAAGNNSQRPSFAEFFSPRLRNISTTLTSPIPPLPSPSVSDIDLNAPIPIPLSINDPYHDISLGEESGSQEIISLARKIIAALTPTKMKKSVTASDRETALHSARQIISLAEGTYIPPAPGTFGTFKSAAPAPIDEDKLRRTIRSCIREEMATLKKEIAPQPPKPSFSDVARKQRVVAAPPAPSSSSPKATPPTTKPAIIVAPKSQVKGPEDTLRAWKESVSFRDTNFAPAGVKFVSNNKLRVEFDTDEHRRVALSKLRNKPNSAVTAEESKTLSPMVIVKGISVDTPVEQLSSIIIDQNHAVRDVLSEPADFTYRFKRANRNNKLYNAVFLVSPVVFKTLIELGKLNIEHQRVHVDNYIPLLHCFRCLAFGHTKARCKADKPTCSHCSSHSHEFKSCPAKSDFNKLQCFNCTSYNSQHSTNFDVCHSATSTLCPRVKNMTQKVCSKINFGA